MKPGFGSAMGRAWRRSIRAEVGSEVGCVARWWAMMRVAERDLPIALEREMLVGMYGAWLGKEYSMQDGIW